MSEEGKVSLSFEYLFGNLQQTLEGGFNRLDRSVEEVRKQLEQKASNESVLNLKKDVIDLESRHNKRLITLEEDMIGSAASRKVKDRGLAFLSALVVAIISALIYVASTGGFH